MPKSKSKPGRGKKKGSSSPSGSSTKSKESKTENGDSSLEPSSAKKNSSASSEHTSNPLQRKADKLRKKKFKGSSADGVKNGKSPSKVDSKFKGKEVVNESETGKAKQPSRKSSPDKAMDAKNDLTPLFINPWTKIYTFVQEDGSDLHAKESMAETQYSFRIPARLIELFLIDETELLEEMRQLKGMLPPFFEPVQDAIRRHDDLIASYSAAKTAIISHKGAFFKRSPLKADASLEFVPVNLHLQRLTAGSSLVHDVVTVGAFTAFAQKFADGGLLQYAALLGGSRLPGGPSCCLPRMLDRLSSGGRSAPDASKASAVYQAETAVQVTEEGRMRILESCAELLETVKADNSDAMPALLETIKTESSRVSATLLSPAVAEMHRELASHSPTGAPPPLTWLKEPPAPPAAPAPRDWRAAAAALPAAAARAAAAGGDRAALSGAVAELRAGCGAALAAARLARAAARVGEERRTQLLRDAARRRRDVCCSQAVTAACVGLLTRLWRRPTEPSLVDRLTAVGPLLQFEGLLSYYGHEAGMVQDMVIAVRDLEAVEFILEPVDDKGAGAPDVRLEGGRGRLRVYLPTPAPLLAGRDNPIRFRARPVFFNMGINEQATFAEYVGGTGPQRAFNEEGFRRLADYVDSCRQSGLMPARSDGGDDSAPEVSDLIIQLGACVRAGRPKDVSILQLAAEICRRLEGIRFCSCKSAKDRTSMAVTLEQVNVLTRQLHLSPAERPSALALMRSEGARRRNAEKNVGSARFSFNTLQLMTMPEEYRPPHGTYGAVQS